MIGAILCAWFAICEPAPPPPAPVASSEQAAIAIAVPLVAKWEGLEVKAYLDTIAKPPVWTVCYGETEGVRPHEVRTEVQCRDGLRRGLARYRADLHRYFAPDTKAARLPPTRDAAFVSTAWNVGVHGLGKSTAVRRLNAGDVVGACEAITWWNKAGGRVIRGLVNRRSEEQALCLKGAG
jgi:GH24 family phage-related lysozyme (muramidase)